MRLISSLDRKRRIEFDSFIKVKRVRQEIVDNQFDSSKTLHTHPSSQTAVNHAYITHTSVLYPNSNRGNAWGFFSYPGAKMHPYPSASWASVWDFHKKSDQHVLKDYSVNTCKANRLPLLAQRQKEAFNGFSAPPHFPLVMRQETVYLRERELLHSRHKNCCRHQLPHPGLLATSYLGPWIFKGLSETNEEQLFPWQHSLIQYVCSAQWSFWSVL